MTTTRDMTPCSVIRQQIGRMNLMACGARQFVGDVDTPEYSAMLQFKVLRGRNKIVIKLMGDDTYTVEMWYLPTMRAKDPSPQLKETTSGVYCDMLGDVVYGFCNK